MTVLVFLDPDYDNGRVADASVPQLMATDLGATRGDGIFESLLALNGEARKVQAHLDRLGSSAHALNLDLPAQDAWRRAIATALDAYAATTTGPADVELAVKLMVTRGVEGADSPTAWVQVSPVPARTQRQRRDGLAVLLLDRGYDSTVAQRAPWLLMGAKTLSYAVNMAAVRYAHDHDADDVIFTSSDGKVLEGPTSTVLLARVRDGIKTLLTPQLESGILPGTSQNALFTVAKAAGWELGYGPLVPADLYDADGVWLISSIRLLAPVNSLDGQQIAAAPELTAELSELVAKIS
ncbi:aminodeoxychorismate lyase [Arthrobacter sp. HLT1-21]